MTTYLSEYFDLPGGYAVAFELDIGNGGFEAVWTPSFPAERTSKLNAAYYARRDGFLALVQLHSGKKVAVVDPGRRKPKAKRLLKGVAR